MTQIKSILIANRGEPVRRATRTFRKMGIKVATIATPQDLASDWVAESDVCLKVSSYLAGDEIVQKTKEAGIDAIWPGWGFLSENADFAAAVEANGLIWIGPSSKVIANMASKSEATLMAKKAGLTTIPEVAISAQKDANELLPQVKAACDEVGFPILLKPALGGGGQGQMVVRQSSEIDSAWQQVHKINTTQFQSGPILIQKFFDQAKHIETQILADSHGAVVVLGERECSVQRRNQKVIEESPSPALSDIERANLMELSSEFARVVGYQNAGTIEYLYSDGKFFFLEMNTRLQVEHSITEETSFLDNKKIDLVECMVRVAQGEKLWFSQSKFVRMGHAIEARIYAEDPEQDYRPSPGTVTHYSFPENEDLRVETAFASQPFEISSQYDPMIAKVITRGARREDAIKKLLETLDESFILGVPTNISLCQNILKNPTFLGGQYTTKLLSAEPELRKSHFKKPGLALVLAGVIQYIQDLKKVRVSLLSNEPTSYYHLLRQIPKNGLVYHIELSGKKAKIEVNEVAAGKFLVSFENQKCTLEVTEKPGNNFTCLFSDGQIHSVCFNETQDKLLLSLDGQSYSLRLQREGLEQAALDPHSAPLAGQIVAVFVKAGDHVEKEQQLYQIESMKMITTVSAKFSGAVEEIQKSVGEPIKSGNIVVKLPVPQEDLGSNEENLWSESEIEVLPTAQDCLTLDCLKNYFLGFDLTDENINPILEILPKKIKAGKIKNEDLAKVVTQILEYTLDVKSLFEDNEHILTYISEQEEVRSDTIPQKQLKLVAKILANYNVNDLSQLVNSSRVLVHLFQAYGYHKDKKEQYLIKLLKICFRAHCIDAALVDPLTRWLKTEPQFDEESKNDIWGYMYVLDSEKYYEIGNLPVALEYLGEYQSVKKDPAFDLDPKEYQGLLEEIRSAHSDENISNDNLYHNLTFDRFPENLKPYLTKWFSEFRGRILTLPKTLAQKEVYLYELVSGSKKEGQEIPPRFVVLVMVSSEGTQGIDLIKKYERAAIRAYRTLRLVQIGEKHRPNNVFLLSKDGQSIPWKTRDNKTTKEHLTPEFVRHSSARASGFAKGINIEATEIILPLLNEDDKKVYWCDIEIRHTQTKGVISRPPFLIEERKPRHPQDIEHQMNERQQKMGKLLNPDRAMLLFDRGEYKELFFPEVDDKPGIGLNVYEGNVNGVPTLAYAGDFRFRGGALGEREGKKLASTVVLAYLKGTPLVAFHDGAGANIKESIASLGWAGAYFGAIAHTGGFSTPQKFSYWLKNHIDRSFFEKVLNHFGLNDSIDNLVDRVQRQLVHCHLHVGATVGMLVYGASIAHASLMCDHDESYRVLTGATTVKKVLGEHATNYSLGGAKAHFEESGDIEMTFKTEEQVIEQTRRLLHLWFCSKPQEKILRDQKNPILEIPKKAGILMGRDAIKSHVDHGEFVEIRKDLKKAKGLLTGYASLAGQPVAIVATTTDYGLSHANAFKKATLLIEAAQDLSLPVILATGIQWEAPSQPVPTDWLKSRDEFFNALKKLAVPKISLALGPRSLELAIHQHMDMCVYVKRGNESDDELQRTNTLVPIACETLEESFNQIGKMLSYVNQRQTTMNDLPTRQTNLSLPTELTQSYDMRAVITEIFDHSSFLELYANDKLPLITGVASLGGRIVGVIADDPQIESGAQNVQSIEKFTRLNRLCERFSLPIVEINDSPAFRPGKEQEHGGIQGVGGRSIREECLNGIPKLAITLRQNYGGRLIHANLITLGPKRTGLILEGAKVGVMGAKGAVGVLYGKKLIALPETERAQAEKKWQTEYEQNQLKPENAIALGYMKGPIQSSQIREKLFEELLKFNSDL